jgi:uncharacterized protein with beta-barrel porin domain
MKNVGASPGGMAATGPTGLRFRNTFLGTVAAGALSLAFGGPALAGPDACTPSGGGTIETCSGNQSAGIASGTDFTAPPVTTLNVNDLTQAIAPATGTRGISFSSAGDITINSNTGAFGITTVGTALNNADGIYANASGNLTVTSTGNVATAGANANGIYAVGSIAVTVTSTGNITTGGAGGMGIFANGAGNGGAATIVTSTGNITTMGAGANGLYGFALSGAVTVSSTGDITTGGGGAIGIKATSGGADVTVTSTGNIKTTGSGAFGIYAENGAGALTVTSTGNITTANADGILAISGAGAVTVTSTGNITTAGTLASGISAESLTGPVTVTSIGNISNTGNNSTGISAQSTGTGAVTVTSTGNITAVGADAIGISAYNQGAGAVAVTSTGNISTTGDGSNAIFASNNGGGAVTVTSIGNITTAGNGTYGIFAFSLDATTVTSTGNITAAGNNATGISAFSAGPIAITIKSGTVSGGSGTGAGVALIGGTTNTLTNFGTVTALSGLAITGDTGNNTVNNFGTVIGNVILGTGTNAFNNMAGGLFNSGTTVNLGAGNTLNNAGTLSPGGAGVIQTTALSGNLVQSAPGRLLTDVNIGGGAADRVNISGTANLAGGIQVQVSNLTAGPWQQTVLTAAGGVTNNGLALLASPVLQAQLVFPDATDVVVKSAGINFLTPGLNNNQTALANAFNGALSSGLGGPIFNVLLNTSAAGYGPALTQLSGEAATGTQQVTFDAMNLFMSTMLDPFNRGTTSTPGGGANGYASEGDASAYAADGRKRSNAERDAYAMFTKAPPQNFEARWNVWTAGFGGSQTTDGDAAVGSNSVTSRLAAGAVGADYLFSPNTFAGFALAGGGTSYSVANGLGTGRSDLFQAGAYVRHTVGQAYIAGALAYGWQDVTTNRTVTLAGLDQLQAKFNANAFSGRIEGGYRLVAPWVGGVGITPYAAAQFTTFDLPAYAEQALVGTNAFALAYGAKSVTDPRNELGFRTDKSFAMADGVLTLRGRLAWAHDYDPDRSIGATFQTLPGASFVVNGAAQASDSVLTTASIERKWINGWSVAATFEGEFSNVTSSYAGKGVVRYQW